MAQPNFVHNTIALKRSKRAMKHYGRQWLVADHHCRLVMALTANRCERCLDNITKASQDTLKHRENLKRLVNYYYPGYFK